jgi:hypothetical protein
MGSGAGGATMSKQLERELARLLAAYRKSAEHFRLRIVVAREALQRSGCTHPKKHLETFRWEHDNGYGRQSMHEGLRCVLCRAECRYPTPMGKWQL